MPRKIEDVKLNKNKKIRISEKKDFDSFEGNLVSRIKDNKINEDNLDNLFKIKDSYSKTPNSFQKNRENRKINWFFVFLIFLSIFGLVYLIAGLFESTKIEIENKKQSFILDSRVFKTSKDKNNDIPFEVMIIEDEDYKNLDLKEKTEVSIKAKGEVSFYNQYSKQVEKINKNTHIVDEKGILYVLDEDVFIPGYTEDEDGEIIPGSVNTHITAFLAGDSYNGEPKNFKVGSFKDTSKYDKIYAQAITPITGGISGEVYILDPEGLGVLKSYAENTFKNSLIRKTKAQIPDGYIFYQNAFSFDYDTGDDIYFKEKLAKVKIKGKMSSVILQEDKLKLSLIKRILPKIEEKEWREIKTVGVENLEFNFSDENEYVDKEKNNFDFILKGEVLFVWEPNLESIKLKLLNIHKNEVSLVLKDETGIVSASVKVFPPWSKYLPDNINKIKISL